MHIGGSPFDVDAVLAIGEKDVYKRQFLVASFVGGIGNTLLQATVNPYVTICGPIEKAAQRMCFMGIMNKSAWYLGPIFLSLFIDVTNPVLDLAHIPFGLAAAVIVLLAILIHFVHLPEVKAEGEDEDELDEANEMCIRDRGGETVLFLTGCHPVRSHPEGGHYTMSANYPGQTREILENEPAVSHSMFLQGCAGDINPKSNSYRETGEQLAQDVTAVLGGTLSPVEGGIFCYLDTIHVAVTPWSQEELQAPLQKAEETPEDFLARRSGRWARLMPVSYTHLLSAWTPVALITLLPRA